MERIAFVFLVLVTSYFAILLPTAILKYYLGYDCELGLFKSYCELSLDPMFSIRNYIVLFLVTYAIYFTIRVYYKNLSVVPLLIFLFIGIIFCIIIDLTFQRTPIYYDEILSYVYISSMLINIFSFLFVALIRQIHPRHMAEYIGYCFIYVITSNLSLAAAYALGQYFPGAVSLFLLFSVFAFLIFPVHLAAVARIMALPIPNRSEMQVSQII